nr:threonine/serine dehydratase [Actinomycetota bacterium]
MRTVDRAGIERTYEVIAPHVRRTPVLELEPGLTLKLEQLQHAGSFKTRGAMANLL